MASGKFVLRIPSELHEKLKKEAAISGQSLNSVVVEKIEKATHIRPLRPWLAKIINTWNPLAVVLFGSTVRGEAVESSDVDLLIVMDSGVKLQRELYRNWDNLLRDEPSLSPQFVHLPRELDEAGSLWLEAALDGEILFCRDAKVRTAIFDLKTRIAEGRFVRRWTYGSPYWVKNVID